MSAYNIFVVNREYIMNHKQLSLLLLLSFIAQARSIQDRMHHVRDNISHSYHVAKIWYHCADLNGPTACRPHEKPDTCDNTEWHNKKMLALKTC